MGPFYRHTTHYRAFCANTAYCGPHYSHSSHWHAGSSDPPCYWYPHTVPAAQPWAHTTAVRASCSFSRHPRAHSYHPFSQPPPPHRVFFLWAKNLHFWICWCFVLLSIYCRRCFAVVVACLLKGLCLIRFLQGRALLTFAMAHYLVCKSVDVVFHVSCSFCYHTNYLCREIRKRFKMPHSLFINNMSVIQSILRL